ncbi:MULTISPECIES: hypothetical protein [unclassified Bradyrhizobium]|uniref:hypothetical protein n=1 Tax=unclassified Bradyrhizobium TaxID=2631580 RepID=UPI001FF997FB|nr:MULTISPECIES: hypothetical protein [unclassified Bradyrhizobium]MCK1536542.1 hypothetical protein [Bradyrhizobium sp. 176]MCK1560389.1 hypothetical protein [Bradyrhizobium sp. 171]MCK1672047.1 hypothetical protein [Bradyrhizobium sp. 150]
MLGYGNHPPSSHPITGSDLEQRTLAPLQVNAMDSLILTQRQVVGSQGGLTFKLTAHAFDDAYAVLAGPAAELHAPRMPPSNDASLLNAKNENG